MAPRSIWNGTIAFGLVNVPVKVYSATESKSIHFHHVHLSDGARIEHRKVCPKHDKEVDKDEIVKGYELSEGKFVELTKDEIAAAAGERSKLIDVEHFVTGDDIDPAFYDKTYYLGTADEGEDAYRLLYRALEKSGKVAIARWVFHDRERLVAVRPLDDKILGLHTMNFHDELVEVDDLDLPSPQRKPVRARDRDGGQAREVARGEVQARRLRGHLPRGGAEADQAQGEGRGDRRGARGDQAAGLRRPDGGAGGEPVMPRPLWTGSLNFGLVNVPVRLTSAVRDLDLHFRQLHAKDHIPIETRRVCSEEDKELDYEEVGNAYDLDGEQVVLTDEELSAADPKKTRTIEIESFVALDEIDPIYYDHPYYLMPAGETDGTVRAYRLLTEVMAKTDRVALGPLRHAHQGVPGRDPHARAGADALDACASTTRSARPRRSAA